MAPQPSVKRQSKIKTSSSSKTQNGADEARNNDTAPTGSSTGKLKSVRRTAPAAAAKSTTTSPQSTKYADKDSPSRRTASSKGPGASAPVSKGSIQSFFSNTSQRFAASQASQETATSSQSRATTPLEDIEGIDSDEDQATALPLSRGSSTALAVRKRKAQDESRIAKAGSESVSSASQKFRKINNGDRASSSALPTEDKRPWTEQFAPLNLDELAVHKRKITDVRSWLEHAFSLKRNKALVLKGGAGTGKTTTLKLLAHDLGVKVFEWTNPAGKDYADNTQSAVAQFDEFVGRSGRSGGLQFDIDSQTSSKSQSAPAAKHDRNGRQLLLVEEFPNTFAKNSSVLQAFRATIAQHLAIPVAEDGTPSPIILIISETLLSTNTAVADSFTTHRLLGPELVMHPHIDTIEFNAVAPTILLKALESVVLKEARKSGRRTTPNIALLKQIADVGDIRSAISALEFLCIRGDEDGAWSAKIAFSKTKKKVEHALTKTETEALKWISNRENTLGIFHAVGKVVYNKRLDPPAEQSLPSLPDWLAQHRRAKVPENDVNQLMNDIGTDTDTFIAALHENYVLSCTGFNNEAAMEVVESSIERLSDGDLLSLDRFSASNRAYTGSASDSLRQEELAFQVVVRGLQFELPANVRRTAPMGGRPGDAHRMFYPASLKLWRRKEEVQDAFVVLTTRLRKSFVSELEFAQSDAVPTLPTMLSLPKTELILQCLPYIATVERRHGNARRLLELMHNIVAIPVTSTQLTGTNDDLELANGQEDGNQLNDWATDRPVEALGISKLPRGRGPRQGAFDSDMNTMNLDEKQMGSLVLEDDDIVDD